MATQWRISKILQYDPFSLRDFAEKKKMKLLSAANMILLGQPNEICDRTNHVVRLIYSTEVYNLPLVTIKFKAKKQTKTDD